MIGPHSSIEGVLTQIVADLAGPLPIVEPEVITVQLTREFAREWADAANFMTHLDLLEARLEAKDKTVPALELVQDE